MKSARLDREPAPETGARGSAPVSLSRDRFSQGSAGYGAPMRRTASHPEAARSGRAAPSEPAAARRRLFGQAEGRITITLPSRRTVPERVVAHLGPTNSGKTYAALEELAAKGAGVYAGPLRMLAQEAQRRLG